MALREARRAKARARPGPVGAPGQPGLPGRAGTPGAPGALVVMPTVAAPRSLPPVGILDVEIVQDGLDVIFVITLTDGTELRRKAKLPEPKKGKREAGTFYLRNGAQSSWSMETVTGDQTLTYERALILVDCSAGNVTLTLPQAQGNPRGEYLIFRVDTSINILTITSPDPINQDTTMTVLAQNSAPHLYSTNSAFGWVAG